MFNFNLRNTDKEKSPFVYRFSFECFGRSVELGLSRKYFNETVEKGLSLLPKTEKIKTLRTKLKEKVGNGKIRRHRHEQEEKRSRTRTVEAQA